MTGFIEKNIQKHIKIHSNENSSYYINYIQHLILNIHLNVFYNITGLYPICLNNIIFCSVSIQLTKLKTGKKATILLILLILKS